MNLWCQLLALCLIVSAFSAASAESDKQVQVTIENGPIVGEVIRVGGQPISRFLGIPFAQPPVGKLRFRKPLPVTKWTEPVQAFQWPNLCVQAVQHPFFTTTEHLFTNRNVSEDCLYLNVWSPKVDVASEDELKPVLVWIHGGGLFVGSSSFDPYDGEILAARADAVIVSMNYRLSTLGFMYSDEVPDVKGNQGLWDQAFALEWVSENIRYFGGNPKQVTIFGESAGGWSVSLQVLSPAARNLYQNAIMMSGSALGYKVVVEPEEYVKTLLTGIRKVGCAGEQDQSISAKVIECLEKLDANTIDQLYYIVDKDPLDLTPIVVVDGEFLPAKPYELLAQGNYKTDVNLLTTTVEDEGSSMLALMFPQFHERNPAPLSLQQAKEFTGDFIENHFLHQPIPKELISRVYYSGLNDVLDKQNAFRKRAGIAFGDVLLVCPSIEFAKEVFKHSPKTTKVYQWYYRAKLGNPKKLICTEWAGTCHCDDLYPVFGIPFRYPANYTDRERDISNEVINFISSFLRTGSPEKAQPEWQPYFLSNDGQEVIAPYYEINNDYKKPENFKFNLKQFECEHIWNKYYRG